MSTQPHPKPAPNSEIEPLYPESRILSRGQHPFDMPYAHRRWTMLIEPATYLNALVRDFHLAGGRIVIREFTSAQDVAALSEELIFNCTGLGARTLFSDEELIPIRGQLVFLIPQPEINYCTIAPGIYMFPRRDGILLGGTFERGQSNLEPDPAISERILTENARLFGSMRTGGI